MDFRAMQQEKKSDDSNKNRSWWRRRRPRSRLSVASHLRASSFYTGRLDAALCKRPNTRMCAAPLLLTAIAARLTVNNESARGRRTICASSQTRARTSGRVQNARSRGRARVDDANISLARLGLSRRRSLVRGAIITRSRARDIDNAHCERATCLQQVASALWRLSDGL